MLRGTVFSNWNIFIRLLQLIAQQQNVVILDRCDCINRACEKNKILMAKRGSFIKTRYVFTIVNCRRQYAPDEQFQDLIKSLRQPCILLTFSDNLVNLPTMTRNLIHDQQKILYVVWILVI